MRACVRACVRVCAIELTSNGAHVLNDVSVVMDDLLVGRALVVVHSILHGLVCSYVGRTHRPRHGRRICQTSTLSDNGRQVRYLCREKEVMRYNSGC